MPTSTICNVFLLTIGLLELVASQTIPRTSNEFRLGAEFFLNALTSLRRANRKVDYKARAMKSQATIPIPTRFPCDVTMGRSPQRPSSVHRLRPGDVDVVGAMGDSIMAAFGAVALDLPSVLVADRGMSFAGGGAETWRSLFTLPNALKLFNPRLVGFARESTYSWSVDAQLNVAEGFAISADMVYQAQLLARRMKQDTRIDFQNDWKMITIMIGEDDFCHFICYADPETIINKHEKEMKAALDFLRDNVPRLFVNILPPPNLSTTYFDKVSAFGSCYLINQVECACLLGIRFEDKHTRFSAIMDEWQRADKKISERGEYRDKEDFAVVYQPFTENVTFPYDKGAVSEHPQIDATYFAPDCFHFSQKLHAVAANALWNNVMQPLGSKTVNWNLNLLEDFICPSESRPYIFTWKNSDSVKHNG